MARSHQVCRNVTIGKKRTSLRMESQYWDGLDEVAEREGMTINELCGEVEDLRNEATSLTNAVRVFLLGYFRGATPTCLTPSPARIEAALDDAIPL